MLLSGISFNLMIAVPVRPSYSSISILIPTRNGTSTYLQPNTSFLSLPGSTTPSQTPAAVSTQTSAGTTASGAAGRYSSVLRVNVQADATFILMLIFWTMAFLALNPLFSLIDALTFAVIHRELKSTSELEPNGEDVALTCSQTPPNTCNDLHVANTEKYPIITKAEAEETKIGDPATITTTQLLYPKLTGIDIVTKTRYVLKDEAQIEHRKKERTPKKEDTWAQSARAFGLGGSAGDFLMAVSIAIVALQLVGVHALCGRGHYLRPVQRTDCGHRLVLPH